MDIVFYVKGYRFLKEPWQHAADSSPLFDWGLPVDQFLELFQTSKARKPGSFLYQIKVVL